MIALIHSSNVIKNKISDTQESNGCHFGFGNKMFKFITELDKTDEELQEQEEKLERAKKELEAKNTENQK